METEHTHHWCLHEIHVSDYTHVPTGREIPTAMQATMRCLTCPMLVQNVEMERVRDLLREDGLSNVYQWASLSFLFHEGGT